MTLPKLARPRLFISLLLAALEAHGAAELVVVANAGSGVASLTREQVVNIFLGRFRQLPNGMTALPVDQPVDDARRAEFYRRLVGKNPAEIRAYWARLVFSGKTSPPHQAATQQEALQWLAQHPGAVGYLASDSLQPSLTVVFKFDAMP